ncbi:MAG: hypothetical protein ABSC36_03245 [Gaiellaceae bacterium]
MGDSAPSTIGFTSSGGKATLLFGVERGGGTQNYRARVDLKSGKISPAEPMAPPVITGGTAAARSLVGDVTTSLGMDSRTRIAIEPARRRPGLSRSFAIVFGGTVDKDSEWKQELAAELATGDTKTPIVSYEGYDGRAFEPIRNVIWTWHREHYSSFSLRRRLALARKLVAAAERDGAAVTSLVLYRSSGSALILTIETPEPAAYLKHDLIRVLRVAEPSASPLAGSYLRVLDEEGKQALVTGGVAGVEGFVGVAPKLEGCSPIDHSYPAGYKLSACPVS